jgi:predicted dehydrogenase
MGRLHARAIGRRASAQGDVALAWTFDHNFERSEAVVRAHGGRAARGLEAIVDECDAAVVAVPTSAHVAVTEHLLEAGIDVMVEKPMAIDSVAARGLAEHARARERILVVGHSEWFNAELERARSAVSRGCSIEVVRAMPRSARGLDLDVIQDLMLHDLDWVARIHGGGVELVGARGTTPTRARSPGDPIDEGRRNDPAYVDTVEVELALPGGGRALLRASRCAPQRERHVRVGLGAGSQYFDLLKPALSSRGDEVGGALDEPLDRAWADFLGACAGQGAAQNDAEVGVAVIMLVERVQQALRDPGAA